MTRAVHDRILKETNGDFSDHLRNHIHLTNCIHLKNHIHKHSPILADRSLMRDLVVLQRSRSLKDPSTRSPSWHSHSVVDLLSKRGEKDAIVGDRRLSFSIEHQMNDRRVSGRSPLLTSLQRATVSFGEASRQKFGATTMSDRSSKSRIRERRRIERDESSRRYMGTDLKGGNDKPLQDDDGLIHDIVSGNSESKDTKMRVKRRQGEDGRLKTLSEQLNEVQVDSDDVASSHIHVHGKHSQNVQMAKEAEANIHGYCSGLNKVKRRKFRGTGKTRTLKASRDAGCKNELSVASNSLLQSSAHPRYHMEDGEEEYDEQNITRAPRKGCGIPWNWSRIHHRGKSFLDRAGRSLPCGLSDSKFRKGGPVPQERDASDTPVMSDHSSSSTKSDAEALPLLVEASGSLESPDNAAWVHDYSGELGICADDLLNRDIDSDLASEARSGGQHKIRRNHNCTHQNLTQKYMPRTFKDLVGQNFVAQAISNAVAKRKVGLLYVFYGPHGTGKTSCARIFARALNCQSLERPKPCGFCSSCAAYDMGKSQNIREVGPVSNFEFESIMDLLDNMIVSHLPSQYRVFIFDDCDTLHPDSWSAISKFIDQTPRRVVFILVSSSLDLLPHIIISRCQKFLFPKLKDADIINALQLIATKEDLDIEKDALKIIASRSDGSLRDAEMTLEQLSLLGQRISVPLVRELVGLIADEKLVELLDSALSADTVSTVKNLREIMGSGVEPLALMKVNVEHAEMPNNEEGYSTHVTRIENLQAGSSSDLYHNAKMKGNSTDRRRHTASTMVPHQTFTQSADLNKISGRPLSGIVRNEIEEIWLEVLDKIQIGRIKEFMYQEGKLISVSFGADIHLRSVALPCRHHISTSSERGLTCQLYKVDMWATCISTCSSLGLAMPSECSTLGSLTLSPSSRGQGILVKAPSTPCLGQGSST
ncbi:hypothetical protein U1Q18_010476 [Sarracenia purpurea var. burkii]